MLSVPLQSLHERTEQTLFGFEQKYRNVSSLLLSVTRSRTRLNGLQLHGHIIKLGFQIIPLISHYLINFYSKTQLPFESLRVFDETHIKSSTTWSSIISSLAQNELPILALQYFRSMVDSGIRPDDHIFPSATKASAILSSYTVGQSVHCFALKTGYDVDVFVGSSLVDMYAKCGKIEDARKVFDEMPMRNVVSWSGMIYGYAQSGENEEALLLFKQAFFERFEVNDFTFTTVIQVCGTTTLLGLGKQLHGLCLKLSYDSSSFVGSSLISMYSKCGIIEVAYQVFDEIPVRNLGMWNAMLIACAQHSHTNKAFELFKEMEICSIKPNFITFLCTLYACSHSGLVEKGKYYFALMKQYGIEPCDQHYASMVDILGRANKLNEALSIITEMPTKPTQCVWGAFLTGCRLHGNTELAAYAADKVFESGPVSSGMHVLLSNTYAAAGRYEDAARARKMMRDKGIKKETGLSWVEEGNFVHTFASGDRRHFKAEEIYKKLEELEDGMEKAGYVADTSYVLREVGGEEKNMAIRYHSERLAIAFALITFSDKKPIRVMKNLRICGDCHTAIKFMSRCSGRVIIVRDNNRFHRFEDGKCSCSDYW
ncbi:putative pentatricopeptide repeat-containing protein At5g52630 [Cynara cardunculus var. scolymus]|uniref:Pentatricopeptide repeat-containing protein n=1 Tax=Cynara cardunculus var. scolymus TaxID=59895 RepID=A0A103XCW4_CYNCS|nr:putative pentatricopeptide repeat-containing protein At5g52630 [Cynara cardunculus var. scolymus]KVH88412.1 Pentatricopeptide repeat-containing protein [Cynara cardunculus var. scolymus]